MKNTVVTYCLGVALNMLTVEHRSYVKPAMTIIWRNPGEHKRAQSERAPWKDKWMAKKK